MNGNAVFSAGKALNFGTVETENKEHYVPNADNYYKLDQKQEVGSQLNVTGNLDAVGKSAVEMRGVSVTSNGTMNVMSEGNINIQEARYKEQLSSGSKSKSRGLTSSTTEVYRHKHDYDVAEASNLEADKINLHSNSGNVTIQGSNVVGENGLTVQAKNIDIKEAENKVYSEDFHSKKKSGVLGGGGLGVTFGAQKQTLESDKTKFYAQGSQVGSLNGNTTLIAENHYSQTASQVSAVNGDVNILAKNVDIKAADDKYEMHTKQTFEQKGVTLAVTSPILSALQAVQGTVKSVERVGQSKNDRVNAMAAANAAMDAYRAGQAVGQAGKAMQEAMENGNVDSVVGAQITYGQQKSESRTHTEGKTAAKSQVNAGGKVNIVATGAGKASNITIQGSDVSGKQGTFLEADNDINITAAEQTHKERSTNKSSGFNAGVAIKVSNGVAAGITVGGNRGKGYGNGDETTYVASHVGDSQSKTVIQAGGDANLIGSQVKGKRVEVNAQNLNIESLQDTATYKGKQMNGSGSVTVGYGASVGGSFNKSNIHADHASVNEQAGIYAGDEGYDINVNHTDLKGGLITSTQKAEDEGKNRFSTGTITHSDIENHSSHNAKGFGVGGGVTIGGGNAPKEIGGVELQKIGKNNADGSGKVETGGIAGIGSQGNWGLAKGLITGLLGQVSDKGSEHGVTTSSINTKHLIIRDKEAQEQLTGKSINETIEALNQENRHQKLAKADVESIKSNLERDLSVATKFVENVNSVGDDIYYNIEKTDKNILLKQKRDKNCEDISCIQAKEIDVNTLNVPKTKEEAEQLARMYAHGIFNTNDEERITGAIQYGGKDYLDNDALVVKRNYTNPLTELTFTVFERMRAGMNLPSIFGASNASRDQAKIWSLLDEYNKRHPKEQVELTHFAHSLGVSGMVNAMNWAKHKNIDLSHTKLNGNTVGTSYPMTNETIGGMLSLGHYEQGYKEKAEELFNGGNVSYAVAPRDIVGTGINLPFVPGKFSIGIGNTNTTGNNTSGIPLIDMLRGAHNKAYYKDEKVINFLYPLFKDGGISRNKVINYQYDTWGQIGPKTQKIEINHNSKGSK